MAQGRGEEEAEAAVAKDLAAITFFILTNYGLHFSVKQQERRSCESSLKDVCKVF